MAETGEVVLPEVDSIESDSALGRIVQPGEQLGDRGFAGAVLSNERDPLPGAKLEIDVADCPSLAPRITEADILKDKPGANRCRHWLGAGRGLDCGAHVEEHEQIAQIKRLLVDVTC